MRLLPALLLLLASTAACAHRQASLASGAPVSAPEARPASTAWDLEIAPLVPGVYLLSRPDVLRQPVEPNVTVIVNEADVVVVDGGGTPRSAENAIRLIRSVTTLPVSILINTHWHGDHTLGNQAYRAAFPGLTIVGHANTRRDMLGPPMRYLERLEGQLRPALADLRARAARGEASERQRNLVPDLELALSEARRTVVTPPDLTVTDGLTLHRAGREIQVRHLGRGNTEGDLVVWLPKERVLVAGDLVVEPIPYGFGSFPGEWIEALDRVASHDFALLVPGHGAVQRDAGAIRRIQALLREVRSQVGAAVARGLDLEATRAAVDLGALERELTGDDAYRKRLFEAWWKGPIVRSAWLEARGLPIVQGASDETG
jgi:glyoxylase-like metal-dependent hydrolase (beta-lactamase superfamily II)